MAALSHNDTPDELLDVLAEGGSGHHFFTRLAWKTVLVRHGAAAMAQAAWRSRHGFAAVGGPDVDVELSMQVGSLSMAVGVRPWASRVSLSPHWLVGLFSPSHAPSSRDG